MRITANISKLSVVQNTMSGLQKNMEGNIIKFAVENTGLFQRLWLVCNGDMKTGPHQFLVDSVTLF